MGLGVLPADRLLVHAAHGDLRQHEGVPRRTAWATSASCWASPASCTSPARSQYALGLRRGGEHRRADHHHLAAATSWNALTVICICLFIGAMGKSAQVPLHVWLPDSMEGPTPISALIHAATMVTAGIFMVARMSPLFEGSDAALSIVLVIGATTALFMGFLGIIQNDIKRVVAYSTLSQLGYMTVALGVSAYSAGVFHLMTHAFFKALLFLAAGSVIIGMHHDQDIRNMGGLRKYMPITWITSLIGSLALIGTPFFSGFYSKDSIILAVEHSDTLGSRATRRSRCWPACSSRRSTASACTSWCSTGRSASATSPSRASTIVRRMTSTGTTRMAMTLTARCASRPAKDDHGHDAHGCARMCTCRTRARWWSGCRWCCWPFRRVIIGYFAIGPMLGGEFFHGAIFIDLEKHPAMEHVAEHAAHPMRDGPARVR